MAQTVADLINVVSQVLALLILARVVLSWVQADRSHPAIRFIHDVTEPILAPIRNFLPQGTMFDFSPMVAILLISFAGNILAAVVRDLF